MSINTTANTAGTTKLNKTFYDRQLLESAKTRFVHAKYGQKRPIPKNSGKRVEFRSGTSLTQTTPWRHFRRALPLPARLCPRAT